MKIGILLAGRSPEAVVSKFGEYDSLFQELLKNRGFTFKTYAVVDMEFPASVEECDGWLISGSRHGVYEEHSFIKPLEAFIREAYANKVPLVGICFGHQIIAQALGGKVEKFKGGWNVGPTHYESMGDEFDLVAWHQDQVIEKPEDAVCLAGNDFCKYGVLVYGDRAFTMQPHPEFHEGFYTALLEARASALPQDYLKDVYAKKMPQLDAMRSANQIENFFRYGKLENEK